MGKKLGNIERKSKGSHIGSFFFGFFIGIILLVALVGGLGAYAYFNVSASWLNNKFKTNINLGSEDANKLTLNTLVKNAIYLGKNVDSYTLTDLEEDFGVELKDKYVGIDITDLKTVALPNILDALQTKFANISAYELKDVLNLDDLDELLSETNTYYLDGETLYKDYNSTTHAYTNPVDKTQEFDYSIEGGKLKIKNFNLMEMNGGKIDLELKYLPLTYALSSYIEGFADNVTIGELTDPQGMFKVQLPSYIVEGNEDKTINQITEVINNLQIAKVLGYTITGNKVMNGEVEVTGIMSKIAQWKINELNSTKLNTLTVSDVFGSTSTGVLSLIAADTQLPNIATAMQTAIETKTLDDFRIAGVINATEADLNKSLVTGQGSVRLGSLTLNEAIDILLAAAV